MLSIKSCLDQVGLGTGLWGTVSIALVDVGGPSLKDMSDTILWF